MLRESVQKKREGAPPTRTPTAASSPAASFHSVPGTPSGTAISLHSDEGENINELFGDIDWANANLGELEQQWRAELASIEEENVKGLLEVGDRSQSLLAPVLKAIDEITNVDDLLASYCQRLFVMGNEIQQIEELNRGLNIQTENQNRLLAELDGILFRISIPDNVLETIQNSRLDDPDNVCKLAAANEQIYRVLNEKFEDGLGNLVAVRQCMEYYGDFHRNFMELLGDFLVQTFSSFKDKFVEGKRHKKSLTLGCLDELVPFFTTYEPLISQLREMDPRRFGNVISWYQNEMATVFSREFDGFLEILKTKLGKKGAEDRSYLFTSLSASQTVGERLLGGLSHQRGSSVGGKDFSNIDPFSTTAIPEIAAGEILSANQALHFVILNVCKSMGKQQLVCAQIFYGIKPDDSSQDEKILKLIDSILLTMYASLDESLNGFVESILKNDHCTALEMLVALDLRIPHLRVDLPAFAKILTNLKRRLLNVAETFLFEQLTAIDSMKFSARKRSGVLPFVSLFPTFISHMDVLLTSAALDSAARDFMHKAYEKITFAIFRSLDVLSQEAERASDEKERINASVMNIQNGYYLVEQLSSLKSPSAAASLKMAQSRYDQHLLLYANFSLHRVFTRLYEFFDGMTTMLESTPPEEVAFHASYNKATCKRILTGFPIKDVRKSLDQVWQRVEKHFSEDRQQQIFVWRIVQNTFIDDSKKFEAAMAKVYQGAEIQLPYSIGDVWAYFSEMSRNK